MRPDFVEHIARLPHLVPFVGPEALERQRGRPFRARLGANENSFGPSPKAVAAMERAAAENWKYSDPENFDLRQALSSHYRVGPENVMIGEGIDGLLGLTCMMFLAPGDHVVTTAGAYPTFNFHVAAHGGQLTQIPMRDCREDLGALLDTARRIAAKLIYVSNPNSPLGTYWRGGALAELVSDLPEGTLLVLDEAYIETAPADAETGLSIHNPQVLRYRTFSKAYGLAGARIGYALGEREIIATFDKVRNHYGINRVGQIGALAALLDQTYLAEVGGRIARARGRIADIAKDNGLTPLASAASFVAIECGGDGAFAGRVLGELLARDVFVRKPMVAGLNQFIRVSCGIDSDVDVFAEELPKALAAARASA